MSGNLAGIGLAELFYASPVAKSLSRVGDRTVVAVNDAYLRMFGVTREAIIGRKPSEAGIHIDAAARDSLFKRLRTEQEVHDVEVDLTGVTGERCTVLLSSQVIARSDDALLLATFVDITQRKEAEARFRQLAESIHQVFWMTDPATRQMLYISPAYEKVWGRPAAALFQSSSEWVESLHPDDRERVLQAASTKQIEGAYDERYRIVRPSGEVRWVRDKAFPVRDATGAVVRVAGVAEDITEQMAIDDRLRQSAKLESIGLLAGGIAHDFNNILCVITANAELLGTDLAENSEQAALVDEIEAAAQRAGTLTRQLLVFSRKQLVKPVVHPLNQTIEEAQRMLRRVLREDIQLRVSLDPEVGSVHADPGQIVQVLMNLCVNARDAITHDGLIAIETRLEAGMARLSVTDNGAGIPPDLQTRVFEPFFTTKGVGRGTGLGLSVVHGIVEQAGGTITLDSRVGVGTTVTIRLPVVARPAATRKKPVVRAPNGAERVLVVDDDDHLRAASSRALKSRGYQVVSACDGRDALRALREVQVDLLVTDIVMPNMNGYELAELAELVRPGLRVLYTSGYPGDEAEKRGLVARAFLPKPFRAQELAAKVRELLDH